MKRVAGALMAVLLLAATATAGDYDINIQDDVTNGLFKDFVREAGALTAYRALAPAEPLGITGFDIGLEASAIDIDEERWESFINDSPDFLPVPRLHVRKGLPFNVDVGLSYSQIPDSNIKLWGGEIQWAALEGTAATPALAFRGSYSTLAGVGDLDLETYAADAVVSKGFAFLTPYAGIGLVRINAEYTGDEQVLKAELDDQEITEPRYFAGIQGTLLLLRITAEAEYMERPIYSLKASLGF